MNNNNKQQSVRVGLFFILGLALAWITFESLSGSGPVFKKTGYTLVAPFANLKGLKTGDDVLMAGVKIGSVRETRLGNKRVEAVLNIDPKVQIPNDALAMVQSSSLLGSQHLAIGFGNSATMLEPGSEIKTAASVDLNEVIAKLGAVGNKIEEVLNNFSGSSSGEAGSPGNLFTKLDKLVTDNGPKLSTTLDNLQDITAKIRTGEGTLGKIVNDPKLYDELLAGVSEIKLAAADARTFMGDTKGIVADVKAGKGTLGLLLYDEQTANNVKLTTNNLREISEKINGGQGTLGKLISDDSLYTDVQGMLKKADRALDGLGDQGPITAVGVVAGALF